MYLAARFLAKNLFSCYPAVIVDKVDPVLKNLKADERSWQLSDYLTQQ